VEIAKAGTIREPCVRTKRWSTCGINNNFQLIIRQELRDMALSELEQERQLQEKNEKELARYRECDPEILLAKGK
jgi:hypothetical protein